MEQEHGTLGSGRISNRNSFSAGDTVNAASSWNTLFTAMTHSSRTHSRFTMTSRSAVSAGDAIAIKAAVAADLATLAASVAAGCPNTTAVTSVRNDLQAPASSVQHGQVHSSQR